VSPSTQGRSALPSKTWSLEKVMSRIPAWAQPRVRYEIAVVAASSHKSAARAWIKRVLAKQGQAALARSGFGTP